MQNTQNLTGQSEATAADTDTKAKDVEPAISVKAEVKAAPKKVAKPMFTVAKKAAATPVKAPAAKPTPAKTEAKAAPKVAAKAAPKAKAAAPAASKPVKSAPIVKAAPKTAKPAAPKVAKESKDKKVKLVRDSIAIPKTEYAVLADLKLRAAKLASEAKKTEIIRAGIKALAAMSDKDFLAAIKSVPNLKTGRPAKG